jgi:integrase
MSRDVCIRYFKNHGLQVPQSLLMFPDGTRYELEEKKELTLKEAARLCFDDPETHGKSDLYRSRFKACLVHLLEKLGPDTPIREIRVVDIKQYILEREKEGAAYYTIKRERGALSKIYRILQENDLVVRNPVSLVRHKDDKLGRRRVYLSFKDFHRILDNLPDWCKPIALTAYYTGMRQGEVRELTRQKLSLDRRLIRFDPRDTKEQEWKLVPVHKNLIPVLKEVLQSQVVGLDKIFLVNGRPATQHDIAHAWGTAVNRVGLPDLHFHDLRHTWKTNARRSGIDEEIRAKIMGHAIGSTHGGYGIVSDKELLDAIDRMTFDHGDTDIWVARKVAAQGSKDKAGSKPGLTGNRRTSRFPKQAKTQAN